MINDKLHELSVDISQNQMNDIISEINFNFTDAAIETLERQDSGENGNKMIQSLGSIKIVHKIEKKFIKHEKDTAFFKNAENRRKMRLASKEYKASLNRVFTEYQQKAAEELRKVSKKDTKELWKILNKFNNKNNKENQKDISLQTLFEHYKKLNENDSDDDVESDFNFDHIDNDVDQFLNSPITEKEIKNVVLKLRNGKAFGNDGILNEYIKNTIDDLMPIYVKLFNIILDTGIVPDTWSLGIMVTIYINKGSKSDPEMYRGIKLNSCFSKTFSAILNNRLNDYAEHVELITKSQAGFRK